MVALDEAYIPTLNAHDRPNMLILTQAHCVRWLQYGLDLFHAELPWASRISSTSITITSTGTITAPTDFIVDILHGIILAVEKRRIRRTSYQKYLSLITTTPTASHPFLYTVQKQTIRVAPAPTSSLSATLHYYAMPDALGPNEVPDFPSHQCMIEYIPNKCLEWIKEAQPGTAQS